jgi:hypothetical protein
MLCGMPDLSDAEPRELSRRIVYVRGQRVLLDETLADLYGASTKAFNQAVRRNRDRFPPDFLIELTDDEWERLRSQFVTLDAGRGKYRKYLPIAFTEHGAIMAAMVLNSPRAVQMSVYVVRAFVRLREVLASNTELARRLRALEESVAALDADTRKQFDHVYEAILGLMGSAQRKC